MGIRATDWAWRRRVGHGPTKSILIALAWYANDADGLCWPKVETLAKRTEVGRSSAYAALATLRKLGLLVDGFDAQGGQCYRLPFQSDSGTSSGTSPSGSETPRSTTRTPYREEPSEEPSREPTPLTPLTGGRSTGPRRSRRPRRRSKADQRVQELRDKRGRA